MKHESLTWQCFIKLGLIFLKQTQIFSGIQFSTHFIEFFFVETIQSVGRNPNMREACGQRSTMAEGSQSRPMAFYFPIRICYIFPPSKCSGDYDIGLCTTLGLAKRMRLCGDDIRLKNALDRNICRKSPSCNAFFLQVPNFYTNLGRTLLRLCTQTKAGWFKGTCEFSGIHFTKHCIEFVFVETNEVVRSNSNVILTRQTCGHRSSEVAGSKRRALELYFSIQIWHMCMISICRGKLDLCVHDFGTCKENAAAQCWLLIWKRVWPQNSSEVGTVQPYSLWKYQSHAQTQIRLSSTFRYYEHIPTSKKIYNASARRLLPVNLLERWPYVCRVKITFRLLPTNCFVVTRKADITDVSRARGQRHWNFGWCQVFCTCAESYWNARDHVCWIYATIHRNWQADVQTHGNAFWYRCQ